MRLHTFVHAGCAALLMTSYACGGSDAAPQDLTGVKLVRDDSSSQPLADLAADWRARFNVGDVLFDQVYLDSQGLGPVYIRAACASCHSDDARGPGSVRKMVLLGDDGAPLADQSALPYGHTVRPQAIGGDSVAINPPDDTSHVLLTVRMPPAVFGRGYLEAISDDEIMRVEAEQAQRDDGVSGRINWVTYASEPNPDTRFHDYARGDRLIGRFGLKAREASLDDFTADAFQGDMGITSELRPSELPNPIGSDDALPGIDISADTVNAVADYMRLLRIPSRATDTEHKGAQLFAQAQCDACHVPSLHTQSDYPIAELADVDAPIYSDMLLHDMGTDFADGLNDYGAASSEWRTPPLMGLRFLRNYLHDGRAKTIEEAIEMHAGPASEAAASLDKFDRLDDTSRADLLKFVSAL
jgi:CxxC motif-containing protein (DUF1111 family)